MQKNTVVPGKAKKEKSNPRKYKIEKDKSSESDLEIELTGDGNYEVEKLSLEGLPTHMADGNPIHWFNNFAIKKDGRYIKEKYFVTIPDPGKSRIVILDSDGTLHYYDGEIKGNTIELTDGDPPVGRAP
jgi:hypothetical protein